MFNKIAILLWIILFSSHVVADNILAKIKIIPLPAERVRVEFQFKEPIKPVPVTFTTQKPPRIVIDFLKTHHTLDEKNLMKKIDLGNLVNYNVASVGDRVRVLLDLSAAVAYSTSLHGQVFAVTLSGKSHQLFKPLKKIAMANQTINARYTLKNIDFHGTGQQTGRIIIDVSATGIPIDIKQTGKEIVAKFISTRVPARLRKRFDVADFQSPAQTIAVEQNARDARITLMSKGDYSYFAYQVNKQFFIDVFPLSADEIKQAKLKKKVYTGKPISLNFQNIPIRSVLQLLADFTGINMVISDKVTGNITLRLNKTPWDQALDIILATNSLDKRQSGNVMWVAPTIDLMKQEREQLKSQQEATNLAPLRSELLQLNYAKAVDMAALLKDKNTSLLSKRGAISVDVRTNTLWIQDTGAQIEEIRELIKRLDIPVRQVQIESRIVNVSREAIEDLGIRFGISKPQALSGSLSGANQIAQGVYAQNQTPLASTSNVTPFTDRLNVDLPALAVNAATVGLAVAKLGNGILLDLELSALESIDKAEIIASPRLMTVNQQPAMIESGEEIPYQESTSSGATAVAFKKAVLSLKVTPQITPDNKLLMELQINQDEPSGRVVNGVPAIATKQIQTNVLVENGQTVVLGGIYRQDKNNTLARVPLLGELPLVGSLFRNTRARIRNEELLIFITPRIITNSLSITAIEGRGKAILNGVELDKFGKPVCINCK